MPQIVGHPGILRSLSPSYAFSFAAADPRTAFLAMGAVVLAITGAEALYADMGHFGKPPIRRAWFAVVFPALTLNYLGQGALDPARPDRGREPLLLPGARLGPDTDGRAGHAGHGDRLPGGHLRRFLGDPAGDRLGFVPHLEIRQTSREHGGQIYLPAINWLVFAGVLILMFTFRSSARLASAYGLAVTGTLLLTTACSWSWPAGRGTGGRGSCCCGRRVRRP